MPAAPRRTPRPTPGPTPRPTAGPPTPARAAVERASVPVLRSIAAAPKPLPFLLVLAFLVAAVFTRGVVGALLVLPPVLFVAWLLYLRWPVSTSAERLGRLAVLALALGIGVVQLFPQR